MTEDSMSFRYPLANIYGDYLKTFIGGAVGIGGLFFGSGHWVSLAIFGGISLLFLVYGLNTLKHHRTRVTVSDEGVEMQAYNRRFIPWADLEKIVLRYYGKPVKKDQAEIRPKGTLMLTFQGKEGSIKLESGLQGFRYLVWRATQIARDNKALLDPTTAGNMLDIGLDPDGDSAKPDPSAPAF